MKNKAKLINIGEVLVSLGLIPMWFVKFFHGVGHLPSKNNPDIIVQVDFYHSMYENIGADVFGFMFPVSITLIAVSVIVSVACLKYPKYKKLQVASHIIFGITFGVFLLSLLLASTVARGY